MGAWSGFGITFRTMFRKTFTQGYPQKGEEKITAPRYHGRHQLNRWPDGLEKRVGCELCAWRARPTPSTSKAPTTPRRSATRPVSATARCTRSTICAASCAATASRPPDARAHHDQRFQVLEPDSRADDLQKDQLLAPLLPGMEEPPHPRSSALTKRTTSWGFRPPASRHPDRPARSQGG